MQSSKSGPHFHPMDLLIYYCLDQYFCFEHFFMVYHAYLLRLCFCFFIFFVSLDSLAEGFVLYVCSWFNDGCVCIVVVILPMSFPQVIVFVNIWIDFNIDLHIFNMYCVHFYFLLSILIFFSFFFRVDLYQQLYIDSFLKNNLFSSLWLLVLFNNTYYDKY